MDEIFDKIKQRLEEVSHEYNTEPSDLGFVTIGRKVYLNDAIKIVDEIKNEYMNNQIFQYAIAYATTLSLYGVDIRDKWETLTHQMDALHQAYIRGRKDERDKFMEWADKKWN